MVNDGSVLTKLRRRVPGWTSSHAGRLNRSEPAKTWVAREPRAEFDVVFVGDTSFGENYQEERERRGKINVLKAHGYAYSLEGVRPLLAGADLVVANLETPLTTRSTSPLEGLRPWLHRSDPVETPKQLLAHNIGVVTLANNHSADYGVEGLLDTLDALDAHGIVGIGAGRNLESASQPLAVEAVLTSAEDSTSTFRMRIFSVYRGGRKFAGEIYEHADTTRPGSAPLDTAVLVDRIRDARARDAEELIVVCPHWRRDYRWRSKTQAEIAESLVEAGADLILGHGSHSVQQIEKLAGRWVIHGIGNFMFNSGGRYKSTGAPPYGLVARLTVSIGQRWLRLYPILINNRVTNFQPRPVTETEFHKLVDLLTERANVPGAFQKDFHRTQDERGWHLITELPGAPKRRTG